MPSEPEAPAAPAADEPANQPAPAAPEPAAEPLPGGLPADDPDGEGTTPEEVAAALKGSGMNLPDEPAAPAADADEEEGADPDNPDEPAAPAADEPAADEPAADEEPPEDPDAKPLDQRPADEDKYSIEVEDANGTTFKIPVGAKMEDILDTFEPKNNGQILDILQQLQKLEAQKTSDEAAEAEQTAKSENAARVSEIRKGWDGEVTDLTAQKRIPEGKDGEARVAEVYKFMAAENDKRISANKPTLSSFEDALDKLENQEARAAKVEQDKKDKDDARENGGKVGGASAPATSTAPPTYKAGSARNANEAIRAMGLLK